MFEPFSSDFKTILTGSLFCTFGRVMYKAKTLLKFVDTRKSCCSLCLPLIENHVQAFFKQFQNNFDWVFGVHFVPTSVKLFYLNIF